ncbi:hypothetical protein ACFL2F_02490 [Myxococcota bacterium]
MALTLLLAMLSAAPAVVQQCDRVEVVGPEEETAVRIAKMVCGRKKGLDALFGFKSRVRVRICGDMQCWRKRSGRPWYISAALVGDEEILTQPAGSLRKIEDLEGTLAHELVHLLIRKLAGRNCPRWLDEGLAQWLSGQKAVQDLSLPADEQELAGLEKRLGSNKTPRERLKKDYVTCRRLVKRLVDRVGEQDLVRSLSGLKNTPDPLDLQVKGKTLRSWLFPG